MVVHGGVVDQRFDGWEGGHAGGCAREVVSTEQTQIVHSRLGEIT